MELFSKAKNREWVKCGFSNSTLGLNLDVDFEIVTVKTVLEPAWKEKLTSKQLTEEQVHEAIRTYNNVAKDTQIVLRAVK